jgi:hypothetical protein
MKRTLLHKNIDFIDDSNRDLATTRLGKFTAVGQVELLKTSIVGLWIPEKCDGDAILKIYDFACLARENKITVASRFTTTMEKEVYHILSRRQINVISIGDHQNDLKTALQIFVKGAKTTIASDVSAITLISNSIVVGSDKFEKAPFVRNGNISAYCLTNSTELPLLKLNGTAIKKLVTPSIRQKQKRTHKPGDLADSV